MESAAGQPRPTGTGSLLGVPGLSSSWDADDDEDEVVIGIKPKSSPLPRRKTSMSDEDFEPEPSQSRFRRVSFADAKGLALVSVKEFDSWEISKLLDCDPLRGDGKEAEEYYLSPVFTPPMLSEELVQRVQEQKLELESVELLPGTTKLKGVIRVLNISFDKMVYVRTSLDTWASHFDLLAEYIPGSSDGVTDCFSFKLTLVPPFSKQGLRVDFCLRYETPIGTFWANNQDRNYVLFCHEKVKEIKEKLHKNNAQKKSCLKAISQNFTTEENIPSTNADPTVVSRHGEEVLSVKTQSSGSIEKDRQKVLVEFNQNCSRRSVRRTARLERVRDYFSQREREAKEKENGVVDPSQTEKEVNTLRMENYSNGPEIQSWPLKHSRCDGSQSANDALSAPWPVKDSPSKNQAEKSETICSMVSSVLSDREGEEATVISNNSSTVQPVSICQNGDKSVCKVEGKALIQIENNVRKEKDGSDISTDRGHSDYVVRSENNSAVPISQTNRFTFGTVVAPLYHQVFGRVESDSQDVTDRDNQTRGRLYQGDSAAYTAHKVENNPNVSSDTNQTHVEQPGNQRDALESDLWSFISGLSLQKESKPVSKKAVGLVPRIPTDPSSAAFTAQISNENSGPQGQSEADTPHFQEQTPKTEPPVDITFIPTQTLQQASLLQAQTHLISEELRAEMIPQGSGGGVPDCVSLDESEEIKNLISARTAEWSTGTYTGLDKPIAMPKLLDTNSRVSLSTTEADNEITSDHQPVDLHYKDTFNEKNVIPGITTKNDYPVLEKDWISLEIEKESETVEEKSDKSDNLCKDTNLSTEDHDGNRQHMSDDYGRDIDNVSNSKEGDTRDKAMMILNENALGHVEDDDAMSEYIEVNQRQRMDATHIEEKDWERIVEEEEEDVLLDEDGSKEMGMVEEDNGGLVEEEEEIKVEEEEVTEGEDEDIEVKEQEVVESSIQPDEPASEEDSQGNISSESVSDDEMELYMYSLMAAHKQSIVPSGSKDMVLNFGKRPSISRSKQLPSPMPSISESVDEEQHKDTLHGSLDFANVDQQPTTTLPPMVGGHDGVKSNVRWWRESFSCHNISKALLYTLLFVVFVFAAYHYDFLACFSLYLFSVFWLCCEGVKQPLRDNRAVGGAVD